MSWRKILFWIHLSLGCAAGIVVLIMSATGVLLTYEKQMISWCDRGITGAQSNAARLPVEEMLTKAIAQNHSLPSAITIRTEGKPAEVSFGRERVLLVDTHSGDVLGESAPRARAFFQSVENWHRWLAAPADSRATGRSITGAANLGFLLLVVSGPFLWMPRRWTWPAIRAVIWFRRGLSGRARDFTWHNAIGIWSTIPLFFIVISGLVMSYPWANNLLYTLTGSEPPAQQGGGQRRPREQETREPRLTGLNANWTKAEQQVQGWKTITLRLQPAGVRGPLAFTIDTGAAGRPDLRSTLTLNSRTSEIIRWEPFSSNNQGRRLRSWFRFIHTGEAGGLPGQTIAGLASAGAVVLVWTGLFLAVRRFIRSRQRIRQQEAVTV